MSIKYTRLLDYLLFQPTHMADFSHIQSLQTVVGEGVGKAVLQLRVAGSAELLTITCPSLSVAENMADLVDGYCRLVNNSSTSIWNRKGILKIKTVFTNIVLGTRLTINVSEQENYPNRFLLFVHLTSFT